MKIAFVMRSAAHFSYHQTTINHLLKRGHEVNLYFEPTFSDDGPIGEQALQEWLARGHNVVVNDALRRDDRWRTILFAAREARSYASYCRRGEDCEFYRKRWQGYLPNWLRSFASTQPGSALFRQAAVDDLLSVIERLAPPSRQITDALRRDKPDCLVASPTNMRFDEEVEYVKAARALSIPSVVPVLSWDNLTTKGIFHVQPDLLLAWNSDHQKEAKLYHEIPAKKIAVTGSPLFDKWFDETIPLRSRSAVCRSAGIDPEKPYVLYLGSSANVAPNESWLVKRLTKTLHKSDNACVKDLQVVFKPHPANAASIRNLDRAGIPVWPRENGMPDTAVAATQFRALMHHAVCAVGVNTTGMVDAVLCDVPTIAIAADEYKKTQSDAEHFRRIVRSKSIYVAPSVNSAVKLVGQILAGKDPRARPRRTFRTEYVRPRGMGAEAGEAAALAIEKAAVRKPAAQIVAEIDREFGGQPEPAHPRVVTDAHELPNTAPLTGEGAPSVFKGGAGPTDWRERSILARAHAFDPVATHNGARIGAEHFRAHLALEQVPVVIGMPLHNNARYLDEALSTLLAQDFRNFALFLLDDASTDGTGKICARFRARDPRVVYERSAQRLGMVGAWRETFVRAQARFPSAKYFAWASDHDRWDGRWLSSLHAAMEQHPAVVLAYPRTRKMHPDGRAFPYIDPARFDTFGLEDFDARWDHLCRSIVGAGNMVYGLMRTSALRQTGVFRPVVFPDRLLMAELAVEGQFHQLHEVLWHRRELAASSVKRQRRTLFGPQVPRSAFVPTVLVHGFNIVRSLRNGQHSVAHTRSAFSCAALYVRCEIGRRAKKLRLRYSESITALFRRKPRSDPNNQLKALASRISRLEGKIGSLERSNGGQPTSQQQVAPLPERPAAKVRDQPPRQPLGQGIRRAIAAASESPVFAYFQTIRDRVLEMMEEDPDYRYSAYWAQEAEGFDYLFDASPLVIAKLREHTYHITGLKSYEYRQHHESAAAAFASKLARLQDEDVSGLFVPEASELGGFGHVIDGAMVNMDTLKFYECLIALDRAGALPRLKNAGRRPIVLEIGAGWGGFAYQLRTLVPNAVYIIIDLPHTLLFSMTYLRATFPDARTRIYCHGSADKTFANLDEVDFVFLPAHALPRVSLPAVDLAVNIASFQEMRADQVSEYVNALADAGCRLLYSLNRDRSKWNAELTSVTEIMASRYHIQRIPMLGVPYTILDWRGTSAREPSPIDYRHQIGRL